MISAISELLIKLMSQTLTQTYKGGMYSCKPCLMSPCQARYCHGWVERWTKQETEECEEEQVASAEEKKKVEEWEGVREGARLMKWASQMKGDTAEERGGRLQRTLMSQPFRQTTLLQPAPPCTQDSAHTHAHTCTQAHAEP